MTPPPPHANVILIGMAGAGKTTLGELLARRWDWSFVDVDSRIIATFGKTLTELQDERGRTGFIALEGEFMRGLAGTQQVIAPGGSVIYNDEAMQHLRQIGTVVFLDASPSDIEQRIGDLRARGVVIAPGQSVADLCRERHPYYVKYSHLRVSVAGDSVHASLAALENSLLAAAATE